MVMRATILALLLAPLGACTMWSNIMTPTPVADCPVVTRASAWIDQMPKVGSGAHKLIVSVKLDDDRPWLLTPVPSDAPGLLTLELSPGGPAFAGNASYREPVSMGPREAVSIVCGGEERARIDKITIAM
jgi:hypothetical protein